MGSSVCERQLREKQVHWVHGSPLYPTPGSSASIPAYALPSSPILNPLGRNKEPCSRTQLSHRPRNMGESSDQRRDWSWDLRLWSPLTHTAAWEFSTAGGPHWASSKNLRPSLPLSSCPSPSSAQSFSFGTTRETEEAVWSLQRWWRLLGTGYPSPSLWRQTSQRTHPTPLVPGAPGARLFVGLFGFPAFLSFHSPWQPRWGAGGGT